MSDDEVHESSDLVQAAILQLGSEDGLFPARAYLGASADDRLEIQQMAMDYLIDQLGLDA